MQALRCDEIDGVPVYWMPQPGDATTTLRASLWFRAGMVDLPLVQHGWLHLLEHSALHGEDLIRRPVNGHVSLLDTAFHVDGRPEDVTEFLATLCTWLSDPRLADLEHEQRVLRAEANQRTRPTVARHLLWHYGARGPGLAGYPEFGLYRVDADSLRGLAARAFTSGNAALALSGAPPAGLRLPLPSGPRLPAPAAVLCDQPYPAAFTDPVGGIAISGAVARSCAATALGRLLTRSLHSRIRDRDGVGYSAWHNYEQVDADTAIVAAGIDVLPEARDRLVDVVCGILDDFARGEFSADDVRDDAQRAVVEMRQMEPRLWAPWRGAREALLDRPVSDVAELEAEMLAVTPGDVQEAAAAFARTFLIGIDAGVPHQHRLRSLDRLLPDSPIDGQLFKPLDDPERVTALTIADGCVQLNAGRHGITVRASDIAAALEFPDGGRTLIRGDGYQLAFEPSLWRRGTQAVALIDRMTDPAVRLPMPEREPRDVPRPRTWRERAARRARRAARTAAYIVGVMGLAGLLALVLAVVTGRPEIAVVGFAWIFWGVAKGASAWLQRRTERK